MLVLRRANSLLQVGGRAAKMRDKLAQMGYTGVQVSYEPPVTALLFVTHTHVNYHCY